MFARKQGLPFLESQKFKTGLFWVIFISKVLIPVLVILACYITVDVYCSPETDLAYVGRCTIAVVSGSLFFDICTASQQVQPYSFLARPIATDSDVFNVIGFGRDLDNDALAASREAFIKGFCSATGLNEDLEHGIQFGDIVWFGKFEPNIRMVDAFRTGRVLLAGGE